MTRKPRTGLTLRRWTTGATTAAVASRINVSLKTKISLAGAIARNIDGGRRSVHTFLLVENEADAAKGGRRHEGGDHRRSGLSRQEAGASPAATDLAHGGRGPARAGERGGAVRRRQGERPRPRRPAAEDRGRGHRQLRHRAVDRAGREHGVSFRRGGECRRR